MNSVDMEIKDFAVIEGIEVDADDQNSVHQMKDYGKNRRGEVEHKDDELKHIGKIHNLDEQKLEAITEL